MAVPKYDALTALKILNAFVPVTRFNKGEVGKIIEEVKNDGPRVIVKNNTPECVMISMEEYQDLVEKSNRTITLVQSKEEEEKRKAFIKKIREHVPEPIHATMTPKERAEYLDRVGPIMIDEEAVNELRRISII